MFVWPTTTKRITSKYGYRIHPITGQRGTLHPGIDIAEPGTHSVFAAAAGTVSRSYRSASYGECIFILHNIGGVTYETVYAHMRSNSRRVFEGQKVKKGQTIGIMGNTGNSTGQHLHFEIHKGRWNINKSNSVDPMKYLNRKDKQIEKLQRDLKALGYDVGTIDGINGNATKNAVKALQRAEGLTVDGIAGKQTLAKIADLLKGGLTMSQYKELKKIIDAQDKKIKGLEKQLKNKVTTPKKTNTPDDVHKEGVEFIKNGISNGKDLLAGVTRQQFGTLMLKYHNKYTVLSAWMQDEIADKLNEIAPDLQKPDQWIEKLRNHEMTAAEMVGVYILGNKKERPLKDTPESDIM